MSHGGPICFISFLWIFYLTAWLHRLMDMRFALSVKVWKRTWTFHEAFHKPHSILLQLLWWRLCFQKRTFVRTERCFQWPGKGKCFIRVRLASLFLTHVRRVEEAHTSRTSHGMRATKPQFILYTVCGQCMVRQQKVILPGRIERSKGSEGPSACTLMQHREADLWYHNCTNIGWIRFFTNVLPVQWN